MGSAECLALWSLSSAAGTRGRAWEALRLLWQLRIAWRCEAAAGPTSLLWAKSLSSSSPVPNSCQVLRTCSDFGIFVMSFRIPLSRRKKQHRNSTETTSWLTFWKLRSFPEVFSNTARIAWEVPPGQRAVRVREGARTQTATRTLLSPLWGIPTAARWKLGESGLILQL